MQDLISSLTTLFTFLTTQLTNISNFFTSSLIGQVFIGIILFSVAFKVVLSFFDKLHK